MPSGKQAEVSIERASMNDQPPLAAAGKIMVLMSFLEPWSMGPGKGAPSLYETLAGYSRAGWQVHFLTCHKRALLGVAHEQNVDVTLNGLTIHRFSLPNISFVIGRRLQAKLDRLLFFPVWGLCRLVHLIFSCRPATIYAYEASAILAAALARPFVPRHVIKVHRIQGVSILGTSYRRLGFMLRKLETLLSLWLDADAYIMTDDGTRGDVVWRYWNASVSPENLLHIRNGLDERLFRRHVTRADGLVCLGLDPELTYLAMVSRLDPIKRIDRGIMLVAALAETVPAIRLVIAGDGEDLPRLTQIARDAGVSERVIFLGSCGRHDVAALMQAADIFLSLYDFSNCGNPLFEALSSGCAIVTLDNGATGDVIKDGQNGLLLPVDDHAKLVAVVSNLISDPEERERLGRGAAKWATKNLGTWEQRLTRETDWLAKRIRS